ncbi:hypothetical protein [Streptomyces sp. NPDC003635]
MKQLRRMAAIAGCAAISAGFAVLPAQAAESGSGAVNTVQAGHVLACYGQAGDRSVAVELYGNSHYGNFVAVSVEGPDGNYGGGSNPATLFENGTVAAEVPIERLGEEGGSVGTASITGDYHLVGEPTHVHDVSREPGWNVVSRGTNQQLSATVTVVLLGETVPLTCGDAFAFDLMVTSTPA